MVVIIIFDNHLHVVVIMFVPSIVDRNRIHSSRATGTKRKKKKYISENVGEMRMHVSCNAATLLYVVDDDDDLWVNFRFFLRSIGT